MCRGDPPCLGAVEGLQQGLDLHYRAALIILLLRLQPILEHHRRGRTMSASLGPEEMGSFGVDQEDYLTGFATKKDPGNFHLASVGMGTDGDVNLDTKPAATKVVKMKGETINFVLVDPLDTLVCYGCIGHAKFCTKLASACGYDSHKTVKHSVILAYYMQIGAFVCYRNPYVPKPVAEWSDVFEGIKDNHFQKPQAMGIVAEVMAAWNARDIEPEFGVGKSPFQHDDVRNVVEGIAA